jgi:hypothetical protein
MSIGAFYRYLFSSKPLQIINIRSYNAFHPNQKHIFFKHRLNGQNFYKIKNLSTILFTNFYLNSFAFKINYSIILFVLHTINKEFTQVTQELLVPKRYNFKSLRNLFDHQNDFHEDQLSFPVYGEKIYLGHFRPFLRLAVLRVQNFCQK